MSPPCSSFDGTRNFFSPRFTSRRHGVRSAVDESRQRPPVRENYHHPSRKEKRRQKKWRQEAPMECFDAGRCNGTCSTPRRVPRTSQGQHIEASRLDTIVDAAQILTIIFSPLPRKRVSQYDSPFARK